LPQAGRVYIHARPPFWLCNKLALRHKKIFSDCLYLRTAGEPHLLDLLHVAGGGWVQVGSQRAPRRRDDAAPGAGKSDLHWVLAGFDSPRIISFFFDSFWAFLTVFGRF